ncbi:uncharacterized protein LOC144863560 [Branchiostoma floridae x Branchiostoma japonicum]
MAIGRAAALSTLLIFATVLSTEGCGVVVNKNQEASSGELIHRVRREAPETIVDEDVNAVNEDLPHEARGLLWHPEDISARDENQKSRTKRDLSWLSSSLDTWSDQLRGLTAEAKPTAGDVLSQAQAEAELSSDDLHSQAQAQVQAEASIDEFLEQSQGQSQSQSQSQSEFQSISQDIQIVNGTEVHCQQDCENGGVCTGRNKCRCAPGWTGTYCTDPICNPACANGSACTAPNVCQCEEGYEGDQCQTATCHSTCENGGYCSRPNYCTCQIGYSGPQCETPICTLECQNGGVCTEPGRCSCPKSFGGPQCQFGIAPAPDHSGRFCGAFGHQHYFTFDGHFYTFPGTCQYLLSGDCQQATFQVFVRNDPNCTTSSLLCHREVRVHMMGLSHDLILHQGHNYEVTKGDVTLSLPISEEGVKVEKVGGYVRVILMPEFDGKLVRVVVYWDGVTSVYVEVDEDFAENLCGLCGNFNGNSLDEYRLKDGTVSSSTITFANSWKMTDAEEHCPNVDVNTPNSCASATQQQRQEIREICNVSLGNEAFASCHAVVDPKPYIAACVTDLCNCDYAVRDDCQCEALTQYSRACAHRRIVLDWRQPELCNRTCPATMVYSECASSCPRTCRNPSGDHDCDDHCVDGCSCPEGSLWDEGSLQCVVEQECSCTHLGIEYAPGSHYHDDCNQYYCDAGRWIRTNYECNATCSIHGDPHITTFDKRYYQFAGVCQYIVAKDFVNQKFTLLANQQPCSDDYSSSCIRSVTLIVGGNTAGKIKLHQHGVLSVGHSDVHIQLPYHNDDVSVRRLSSVFVEVTTNFGLTLQWDGRGRLYTTVTPALKGHTKGLCGTFNDNQNDDFTTRSGGLVVNVAEFGNSWKVSADCEDQPGVTSNLQLGPCAINTQREEYARQHCGLMSGGSFEACNRLLEPATYITACEHDVCQCQDGDECLCSAIAHYARECAKLGAVVNWRTEGNCVEECPQVGQVWQECSSACRSSCRYLSEPDSGCTEDCVAGCNCPPGLYQSESGACVQQKDCQCFYQGEVYQPQTRTVLGNLKCRCEDGIMNCQEHVILPSEYNCTSGMEYFDCEGAAAGQMGKACEETCGNIGMECLAEQCVSGCQCPHGLVRDGSECVLPEACRCEHNGQMYDPGQTIRRVDCNSCTCSQGLWSSCTTKDCAAQCSMFGNSHYTTFDGHSYEFEGTCKYIIAQDYCYNQTGSFRIHAEKTACNGLSGNVCARTVTVTLQQLQIHLEHGKDVHVGPIPGSEVPYTSYNYKIYRSGFFTIIKVDNGIDLYWDNATRLYIKVWPNHRGRVCGMCGNFDGNQINDFNTPELDRATTVQDFANSWKVSSSCPDVEAPLSDYCALHPHREAWARRQCSIILSDTFRPCHFKVDPEPYYQACVQDSCSCDSGGDCECFCTAVAAYGDMCNTQDIHIRWRTHELCPTQCEDYNWDPEKCEWHYDPCGTSCPATCEDPHPSSCDLQCMEGCHPKCPDGTVLYNSKCIPPMDCPVTTTTPLPTTTAFIPTTVSTTLLPTTTESIETTTLEVTTAAETTPIPTTAAITTEGTPTRSPSPPVHTTTEATTTQSTTPPTTASTTTGEVTTPCEHTEVCYWTSWINSDLPRAQRTADNETLAHLQAGSNICTHPSMIECRTSSHNPDNMRLIPVEQVDQEVTCDVDQGFLCLSELQEKPFCLDYEVRLYCCSCGGTVPPISTTTQPTTTESTTSTVSTTSQPTTTESTTSTVSTTTLSTTTETTTASTTKPTTTESTTVSTTTHPTTTETTTTIVSTTPCEEMECEWKEWMYLKDEYNHPSKNLTYANLRDTYNFCPTPRDIQCRIREWNTTFESIDQVGVTCDINSGLYCDASQITRRNKRCYDFEIRVKCCSWKKCVKSTSTAYQTTTTESTTVSTTQPTTTESTTVSTTQPTTTESTTVSTTQPTTTESTTISKTTQPTTTESTTVSTTPQPTTTESTTVSTTQPTTTESTTVSTTPQPTTTEPTTVSTTSQPTTAEPTTVSTTQPTTKESTTITTAYQPTTTESTTSTVTSTTQPWSETTTESTTVSTASQPTTTEPTTVSTTQPTTTESTTVSTTTHPTTTETTTTIVSTTPCEEMECEWKEWMYLKDEYNHPSKNLTYANLRDTYNFCPTPRDIQCRIREWNTTFESIDQVGVTCDINSGLYCDASQITRRNKRCYDFEIRVKCCSWKKCVKSTSTAYQTTTTESTTVSTTQPTTTESTTVSTTQPTTTESTTVSTTQPTTTEPTTVSTTQPTTTESTTVSTTQPTTTESTTVSTTQPTTTESTTISKATQPTTTESTTISKTTQPTTTESTTISKTTQPTTTEPTTVSTTPQPTTTEPTTVSTTSQPTTAEPTTVSTTQPTTKESTTITTAYQPTTTESTTSTVTSTTQPWSETTTESTTVSTASQPTTTEPTTVSTTQPTTTESTTVSTTTHPTTTETTTTIVSTTPCEEMECEWKGWMYLKDEYNHPSKNLTYANLRDTYNFCPTPRDIQCRIREWNTTFESIDQVGVTCDINSGLYCDASQITRRNKRCYDFEIRVKCCSWKKCVKSTSTAYQTTTTESTTVSTTQPTTTEPTTVSTTQPTTTEPTTVSTTPQPTTTEPTTVSTTTQPTPTEATSSTTFMTPTGSPSLTQSPTTESTTISKTTQPTTTEPTTVSTASQPTTTEPTTVSTTQPTTQESTTVSTTQPTTTEPTTVSTTQPTTTEPTTVSTTQPTTTESTTVTRTTQPTTTESTTVSTTQPTTTEPTTVSTTQPTTTESTTVTRTTQPTTTESTTVSTTQPTTTEPTTVSTTQPTTTESTTVSTTQPTTTESTTVSTTQPTTTESTTVSTTQPTTTEPTTVSTTQPTTTEPTTVSTTQPTTTESTTITSAYQPTTTESTTSTVTSTTQPWSETTTESTTVSTASQPTTTEPTTVSTTQPTTTEPTTITSAYQPTTTESTTSTVTSTTQPWSETTTESTTVSTASQPTTTESTTVSTASQPTTTEPTTVSTTQPTTQESTTITTAYQPTTTESTTSTVTSTTQPWSETTTESTTVSTASQPTTTEPTTVATTALPTTTASLSPSTTECPDVCIDGSGEIRQVGDVWSEPGDQCQKYMCHPCGKISSDITPCDPVEKPSCENGLQPINVGVCCPEYHCPCECTGFGDPHYKSFDGKAFEFQGKGEFILARNTHVPYDFEVRGVNVKCIGAPLTTCTKEIKVIYKGQTIELKPKKQVLVNGSQWSLPFKLDGCRVTTIGMTLKLEIQSLDVTVEYNYLGWSFYISVPPTMYAGKTEGLCGLCNNNKTDDNCSYNCCDWKVPDSPSNISCNEPEPSSPPSIPCDQSPCDVISDQKGPFGPCHAVVNYTSFLHSCQYDRRACFSECQVLTAYANDCQRKGVCVDWRGKDNNCTFECEAGLVYNACSCVKTCENRDVFNASQCELAEGCFCPDDLVLHETSEQCIEDKTCNGCEDENGMPHDIGDTWIPYNGSCQECTCTGYRKTECYPRACPTYRPPKCGVCESQRVVEGSDSCCPEYECVCDLNRADCPEVVIPQCKYRYQYVHRTNPGKCVPEYECRCNFTQCPAARQCGPSKVLDVSEGECCKEYKCSCIPCSTAPTPYCPPGEGYILVSSQDDCGCETESCKCREDSCSPEPECPDNKHVVTMETGCCPHYNCTCNSCPPSPTPGSDCPYGEMPGYVIHETVDDCGCVNSSCTCDRSRCPALPTCDDNKNLVVRYTPCCQNYTCECKECPVDDTSCGIGETQTTIIDDCSCRHTNCTPEPVCVYQNTTHQPGTSWTDPNDNCIQCQCLEEIDPATGFHRVSCSDESSQCGVDCPACHTYQKHNGECCGECVKTSCCVMDDGTLVEHPAGSNWTSPGDSCSRCYCLEAGEHGQVVESCSTLLCPEPPTCMSDEVMKNTTSADGCCTIYECVPPSQACSLFTKLDYLRVDDCMSLQPVNVTWCEGRCGSSSMYEGVDLKHTCECCHEVSMSEVSVPMECEGTTTSSMSYAYRQITACDCDTTECEVPTAQP